MPLMSTFVGSRRFGPVMSACGFQLMSSGVEPYANAAVAMSLMSTVKS